MARFFPPAHVDRRLRSPRTRISHEVQNTPLHVGVLLAQNPDRAVLDRQALDNVEISYLYYLLRGWGGGDVR